MLVFSPLGNNTRGNEIFLSLRKNNFRDKEIWFVLPLSMIQRCEEILNKPSFATAAFS